MTPTRVRSIFLSDVHLGMRACQAERLLEFLDAVAPDVTTPSEDTAPALWPK